MTHITRRVDNTVIRMFLRLVPDVVQLRSGVSSLYFPLLQRCFKGENTSPWELSRGARGAWLGSGCLARRQDRGWKGRWGTWQGSSPSFVFRQGLETSQITADSQMEEKGNSKITLIRSCLSEC